jgi:hypothetical protein
MTHIELVIWTGKQDSVIVDVGFLEGEDLVAGLIAGMGAAGMKASLAVRALECSIDIIGRNGEEFKDISVDELLKAKQYLSKLKTACELHPECRIRVGTI